jgi:hypothetical protein
VNGMGFWVSAKKAQLLRQEMRMGRSQNIEVTEETAAEVAACRYEREIETQVINLTHTYDEEYGGKLMKPRECWTSYAPVGKVSAEVSAEFNIKFKRRGSPKGPMAVFGFDYFEAEWARRGHTTKPKLLEYEGLWGGGEEYAYEVLNFADGKRNAQEIRDAVSAEYGPVPLELVVEYLKALAEIGVVEKMK